MTVDDAVIGVSRLYLDTSPIIYLVQLTPTYLARVSRLFERMQDEGIRLVASPVTLSECLVHPYRTGELSVADEFRSLLAGGGLVEFVVIDQVVAELAAEIRARTRLSLTDSLQIASATAARCDAILTNDVAYRKAGGPRAIVIDDLDP